jgi:uncharacterized protein
VTEHASHRDGAVAPHELGSAITVTIVPRAAANAVELASDGTLRVRITAPPVDGAANAALLRYLADVLDVPRSRLTIAAGHTSRRKRIVVAGLPPDVIQDRINSSSLARRQRVN